MTRAAICTMLPLRHAAVLAVARQVRVELSVKP